jgi:hypothetical protein
VSVVGRRNAAEHPRDVAHHVQYHHKVMHIVRVAGGDINPPSAGESAYESGNEHDGGESGVLGMMEEVLQEDEREAWA